MKHINDLEGIGDGKTCLIVGGGHSVNDFDFSRVPKNVSIIGTNQHKVNIADIVIYYDKDMRDYFNDNLVFADYLIGFTNNSIDYTSDNCTHYYNYNDITFGDTGFHALQFAERVFNFENIYLIGYDYQVKGDSYHFEESKSDEVKQKKFINWSINQVLTKYSRKKWKANIYNCFKGSKLTLFPYKLLTNS